MFDGPMTCRPEGQIGEAKPLGVLEHLKAKKLKLEEQINEIDTTISMFEKHPEVEACLTQLSRIGIYR